MTREQNEDQLAEQLVGFLQQFLEVFSELKGKNFYTTGESVSVLPNASLCKLADRSIKYAGGRSHVINHYDIIACGYTQSGVTQGFVVLTQGVCQ